MSDVEFWQDDYVELQSFRLVDGHHADVGHSRISNSLLSHQVDEIVHADTGLDLITVSEFHELQEAAEVPAIATRGQLLGPLVDGRPISRSHQGLANLEGQPRCGGVSLMVLQPKRLAQG